MRRFQRCVHHPKYSYLPFYCFIMNATRSQLHGPTDFNGKKALVNWPSVAVYASMETWPSGRRRSPAKGVDGKPSRGFESHRLRHFQTPNPSKGPDWGLYSFCFKGRWLGHSPSGDRALDAEWVSEWPASLFKRPSTVTGRRETSMYFQWFAGFSRDRPRCLILWGKGVVTPRAAVLPQCFGGAPITA